MRRPGHRRVVTGLDADGRSTVLFDDEIPRSDELSVAFVWRSGIPADNSDREDTAVPYTTALLQSGHANFMVCSFPARSGGEMHATDTVDYLVILSGRVTLVLEDGEAELGPGDFVVDRGVLHAWRNDGDETCTAAAVNIPAHPVGAGRTI